jgi:hypothetical protein
MQVALQWRVAHACNAAQGQLVEDELVVAADIVTSEGRVTLLTSRGSCRGRPPSSLKTTLNAWVVPMLLICKLSPTPRLTWKKFKCSSRTLAAGTQSSTQSFQPIILFTWT